MYKLLWRPEDNLKRHFSGASHHDRVSHHITSQVSPSGWPASPKIHLSLLPGSRVLCTRVLGPEPRSLCLLCSRAIYLVHAKAFERLFVLWDILNL